jgi:cytochrome c553
MRRFHVLSVAVSFLALTVMASVALAAYQHAGDADTDAKVFLNVYPLKKSTKLDNCALCHSGGSVTSSTKTTTYGSCQWCHLKYGYDMSGDITLTLNSYGKDYLTNGRNEAALRAIEQTT